MSKKQKRRAIAILALCLLTVSIVLCGCSFSNAEKFANKPIIGTPLGNLFMSAATAPADPCHSMMDTILDTSYIKDIAKSAYLSNKTAIFGTNVGTNSVTLGDALWNTVNEVFEKLQPVGIALCTTFFIISLIAMASKDNATLEHYIREVIKFIVAVTIITNLGKILNYTMRLGDSVTAVVANKTSNNDAKPSWEILLGNASPYGNGKIGWQDGGVFNDGGPTYKGSYLFAANDFIEATMGYSTTGTTDTAMQNICSNGTLNGSNLDGGSNPFASMGLPSADWTSSSGEWKDVAMKLLTFGICTIEENESQKGVNITGYGMLGYFGSWYTTFGFTAIIWLCTLIAKIAAYFAIAQRLLDIGWRAAFAPIGAANMFDGQGGSTPGVRYLKSFLGACLSGALLIMILSLGTGIAQSVLTSVSGAADKVPTVLICAVAIKLATVGAAMGCSNKIKEVLS